MDTPQDNRTPVQKLMAAAKRINERRRLQALQQVSSTKPPRHTPLFDRLHDWLGNLGHVGQFLLLTGFIGIFFAFDAAMSERRPIAAFAETYAAWALGLGIIFVPLWMAISIGERVAARTNRKKLVFLIGLVLWWCITATLYLGALQIPWIGWRFERLFF